MKNLVAKWWKKRLDKYYFRKRWHIVADICLISVAITLLGVFIFWSYLPAPAVDTSNVPHTPKPIDVIGEEPLSLQASLNADSVQAGRSFDLQVILSNKGDQDIDNINLAPSLSNNKFYFSRVKSASSPDLQISGRQILLKKLKAGESKEFELNLTLNNLPDSPRLITWRLNADYQKDGAVHKIHQSLPDLKLTSALNVKAAAYYNSPQGDQLGSGPIPPQVDMPTSYWIFISPENIGNNLSGFMVSGVLPENVSFYDRKSLTAGKLSYNDQQRRITWTVPALAPEDIKYQAAFEVQLIPEQKQIGKEAELLTDIIFSAQDSYTQEVINGKENIINTRLPLDPINKDKGVVTE